MGLATIDDVALLLVLTKHLALPIYWRSRYAGIIRRMTPELIQDIAVAQRNVASRSTRTLQ